MINVMCYMLYALCYMTHASCYMFYKIVHNKNTDKFDIMNDVYNLMQLKEGFITPSSPYNHDLSSFLIDSSQYILG